MKKVKFIIGPCAIENMEHALRHATYLKNLQDYLIDIGYNIEIIYKSCFNKANRSNVSSFHGVGMKEGRRILKAVSEQVGLRVTSDVHTVAEVEYMAPVLDLIQIPAHLQGLLFP